MSRVHIVVHDLLPQPVQVPVPPVPDLLMLAGQVRTWRKQVRVLSGVLLCVLVLAIVQPSTIYAAVYLLSMALCLCGLWQACCGIITFRRVSSVGWMLLFLVFASWVGVLWVVHDLVVLVSLFPTLDLESYTGVCTDDDSSSCDGEATAALALTLAVLTGRTMFSAYYSFAVYKLWSSAKMLRQLGGQVLGRGRPRPRVAVEPVRRRLKRIDLRGSGVQQPGGPGRPTLPQYEAIGASGHKSLMVSGEQFAVPFREQAGQLVVAEPVFLPRERTRETGNGPGNGPGSGPGGGPEQGLVLPGYDQVSLYVEGM